MINFWSQTSYQKDCFNEAAVYQSKGISCDNNMKIVGVVQLVGVDPNLKCCWFGKCRQSIWSFWWDVETFWRRFLPSGWSVVVVWLEIVPQCRIGICHNNHHARQDFTSLFV